MARRYLSSLLSASAMSLASTAAFPRPIEATGAVATLLNRAYPEYSRKLHCWIAEQPGQGRYCMSLLRVDRLKVGDAERTYVLLGGRIVDENGQDAGAHANSGLVGAFVLQEQAGQTELLAGNKAMLVGTFGRAPETWRWTLLGPDNYWGWMTTWSDCHQGYCGTRQVIIAPYGKSMRDLAGNFAIAQDDTGTCADDACKKAAPVLGAHVEIDSSQTGERVFPLRVTVSGREDGKEIAPQTLTFPFNARTWRYVPPKGWPLEDADF